MDIIWLTNPQRPSGEPEVHTTEHSEVTGTGWLRWYDSTAQQQMLVPPWRVIEVRRA